MPKNKNKVVGSRFMYEVIKKLSDLLGLIPFNNRNHAEFNIATTQAVSKTDDGRGIDVHFHHTLPSHLQNLKIQCKSTIIKGIDSYSINIKPLMDIKSDGIKILWTRVHTKVKVRKHLVTVVTMEEKDFLIFLKAYDERCRENERLRRNGSVESIAIEDNHSE